MIVCVCICRLSRAESAEEISAIREMNVKVVLLVDNGAFHTQNVTLISPEIRVMVDNMCFLAHLGRIHDKTMF